MLGEEGQQQQGAFQRLKSGWRGGVAISLLLAFLILVVVIIFLILTSLKARSLGGELTVMEGKTKNVEGLQRGIQVIVNIFGIVLIVIANYVFQILSSPTRPEVDESHEKLQWMDIGIPSIRNLTGIAFGRAFVAATVLTLAVGSHIM